MQIDSLIPLVILISALYGVFRGLVREVFSLLAWILAWWVARHGSAQLVPMLAPWIHTPSLRMATAFLGLLLATWLLASLIAYAVQAMIGHLGLTWTDRLLGAVFGLARGVLMCIVALIVLAPYVQGDPWWKSSPWVATLMHFAPETRQLGEHLERLSRSAM